MSTPTTYPDYLWWIVPGFLAGMPRPPLEDIARLYQAGLGGVVSVIDEPDLIKAYQQANLAALALPIPEDLPPTVEQVKQFIEFADKIRSESKAVAVHCTGGNHRTGTLLAAYFVAKGEKPAEVMTRIHQIRPTAQLSPSQIQFLEQISY